jgi:hypothetical protein
MCSSQDHARRTPSLQRLLPPRCAQTPAITGLQSRKAELGNLRREIIAAGLRILKKSRGHEGAHGVAADVLAVGIAASVAKKTRHRAQGADFESITQSSWARYAGRHRPCQRHLSTSGFSASSIPMIKLSNFSIPSNSFLRSVPGANAYPNAAADRLPLRLAKWREEEFKKWKIQASHGRHATAVNYFGS